MMKSIAILVYLIVLAFWDAKEKKVPVWILAAGTIGGMVCLLVFMCMDRERWQWELLSVCLAVTPGVFFLVVAKITGKAGLGDGWALINVGMFENYKTCLFLAGISLMIMAVFALILLVMRKVRSDSAIPFIPFLLLAYMCRFLW